MSGAHFDEGGPQQLPLHLLRRARKRVGLSHSPGLRQAGFGSAISAPAGSPCGNRCTLRGVVAHHSSRLRHRPGYAALHYLPPRDGGHVEKGHYCPGISGHDMVWDPDPASSARRNEPRASRHSPGRVLGSPSNVRAVSRLGSVLGYLRRPRAWMAVRDVVAPGSVLHLHPRESTCWWGVVPEMVRKYLRPMRHGDGGNEVLRARLH